MGKQNIDPLFKKKLETVKFMPSANAWKQVEKHIKPQRYFKLYRAVASVLIMIAVWFIWLQNVNKQVKYTYETGRSQIRLQPEWNIPIAKTKHIRDGVAQFEAIQNYQHKPYPLAATAAEIKATGLSGTDQQPAEVAIVEEVEILDLPDSSKVIALEKVNDPLDRTDDDAKPRLWALRITYKASTLEEPLKSDITGTFRKLWEMTRKISPGEMLADIKIAKDDLINGGLKSKKGKRSL